jgi:hypothetical protein
MRSLARAAILAAIALAVAALPAAPAAALDCTPMQSWDCTLHGYLNILTGQPGEVLCSVDYTGWTMNVVEVTITQGGWVNFTAGTSTGVGSSAQTAIMLMDDCGAGTCVSSIQSDGLVHLLSCLEPGTYTYVVASDSTSPTAYLQMDITCVSCEQAETWGYPVCPACNPVGDEAANWGSLKAQFK